MHGQQLAEAAVRLRDGAVEYRNRFTRTRKWLDEEAFGAFEYATWTTQAPGGAFSNLFASNMLDQAGVTVFRKGDRLFAFDEGTTPYELKQEALDTQEYKKR